tara:strand:+ start:106 stop:2991 length:2886 start_codon:yes stop_codon:yes gene_type:complete
MRTIIQQLEDLKEWAQNPERYERRLAFRSNLPSTEAGTIPPEFDELSDREVEYYKTGPWSTREDYRKGQLVQPGPGRQGYAESPDAKKIEKGIYQRVNKNYRIKANRAGVMLDKTLAKGSTIEDARKVLSDWEAANPIDVKWKKGQKIKLISKGQKGKQITTDILYRTPKIKADFKTALIDFAGENKGNWNKAKFQDTFGGIVEDAMQFVREQNPELIRDWDAVQTKKYRTHLDDLGIKDWASANKKQRQVIMTKAYRVVNPYERTGYSVAREQLAKNIGVLNKFEKSGQTLEYFYDIVKDRTFKKNLRAYLNGTAGEFVTEAFDEAGIKTKYKNILPKIKDHLEVWHEYENPGTAYKGQLKKAKIKKWSDLHTENMISKAKRVGKKDYANMLDLAHRQDLIIDQNISELGIERPEINRVLIKDAELERNKLHRKNFELVDEIKKGNNVEKNLRLINENNARITKIAELTKGRLTGITINPDTLEAVKLKPSNVVAADAGILNKSIKNLSPDDKKILKTKILPQMIEEARAMTPQKIATELSGIMTDEALSKKLATRMKNLKAGKQITKPVFEQSQEVYKIMQGAGFPIDKCLNLVKGGSPDQCIKGVVNETIEKAKRGDADAIKIFKNQKQVLKQVAKRGTGLATKLSWFVGPVDAPIELAFALPHLLMGDYEAAKRATTLGSTGWGKVDLDNVDDPEARKYMKHIRDTENWINNWEKHDYYTKKLENLPDDASRALRKDIEAKINTRASNMNSIAQNYDGYDRSGSENEYWAYNPEEMAGKKAARNWIDTKVETDLEKGLDATYRKQETPVGEIDISAYKDAAREKLRASPTDLESYIKTKGQDFYGDPEGWFAYDPLKREEAEAHGIGHIYDDYYMGASEGKDIRDSYSAIPLEYASQLGALEAKETRDLLFKKQQRPFYRAEGGIASIRRPWAIPPESGPDPQGLAYLNNYATKRTE